ncbi:MAG: stage V sporulation protein AC [Clostridia bacterium]|nr:stage V sporulation protein AC [Clostridia bacterium]MBQ3470852.1 stage V sporulation protein AC [Clostridia bacterium]MBQ6530653.1 stage V sporulation protein AC [Clostridia bacterium]MBQ6557783.1 stage V sporulation protein AC [Clostridia bacterium]MBQ9600131.1 stage V sporulation protein AC [Clostridia bacterium]
MRNEMTNQEYGEYVKTKTPNSTLLKNCIKAFLIGGLICTIGEGLMLLFANLGLDEETAAMFESVTLIFASALLTGLDIYPKIAKHAGAGTVVPITGFANAVVSPALEAKTEGMVLGIGAKIFTIAGPVILYGTLASWAAGILYWILGMVR